MSQNIDGYDSLNSKGNTSTRSFNANQSFKPGNNIITTRANNLYNNLQSLTPSLNMADANMKTLRLFRRACRLMPWLINMHQFYGRINVDQAKLNLAGHFREKSNLNNPKAVDFFVQEGYKVLHDAEHKYSDWHHFNRYIQPSNAAAGNEGISYLDEKKFEGKSKFLAGFYKGNRPNF